MPFHIGYLAYCHFLISLERLLFQEKKYPILTPTFLGFVSLNEEINCIFTKNPLMKQFWIFFLCLPHLSSVTRRFSITLFFKIKVFPDNIYLYTQFCMLLWTAMVRIRHDQNVPNSFLLIIVKGKKCILQTSFTIL